MNFYYRKNSALILFSALNRRDGYIELANHVHDKCPLNYFRKIGTIFEKIIGDGGLQYGGKQKCAALLVKVLEIR